MKPSERDFAKARCAITSATFKAAQIMGECCVLFEHQEFLANSFAEALASERANLPESVKDYIENFLPDELIADYRKWQQGEGPEPRKDGET